MHFGERAVKSLYGAILGLRLSRPRSYIAWARFLGLALLSVLTVMTVLVLLSAHQVVARQQAVVDHRTPRQGPTSEVDDHSRPALLVRETTARWSGVDVTVVTTATRASSSAAPPGVPRLPAPGEVYASPAFLQELSTSSTLRLLVGDDKIVGPIGKSGLRSPAELRLIRGTKFEPQLEGSLAGATTFGARGERIVDPSGPLAFVLPLMLIVILAPIFLATALVSRLRAPETDHRSQLLSALGIGRAQMRTVAAAELLPACLLGAAIGWMLFAGVWQHMNHVPGTGYHFWPSDTALSSQDQITAVLLCVSYTLIVAALTGKPRQRTTTVATTHGKPPASAWLLSPILAAGLLTFATFVESQPAKAKIITIAAAAILVTGLPGCSRIIVHRASAFLADHATGPGALLGGRRLGASDGAAFRLALVIAAPFIQELKVDPRRGEGGLNAARGYNLFVGSASMTPEAISKLPGVKHVLPASTATDADGATIPVLYAGCAQLRAIVSARNCSNEPQLIRVHENQPVRRDGYGPPLKLSYSQEAIGSIPESIVDAPLGDEFFGGLLLPPGRSTVDGSDGRYSNVLVNLKDGLSSLDNFEAELTNRSPSAFFTNSYQDQLDQAKVSLSYAQLVQAGSAIGILALIIALAAAALRNVAERKHETRILSVLGVTQKSAAIIHLLVQASPILITGFVAAVSGVVIWVSLGRIDQNMWMSPAWWLGIVAAPVINAAIVSCLTMPAAALRNTTAARYEAKLWS